MQMIFTMILLTLSYHCFADRYVPDENHNPIEIQKQEAREQMREEAPFHSGHKLDMKKKKPKDVDYNSIDKKLMDKISPDGP